MVSSGPFSKPLALVTGNQGFLGRHFTARLREQGYQVEGYDTAVTSSQDCRTLFDLERRHRTVRKDWDLVVHCAALVGGRETIENSPLETAASLALDAEMFRWAAVVKPRRVLYISSSAAYPVSYQRGGLAVPYRLHEDDIWGPDGLVEPDEVYGWSKVTGEMLAGKLRAAGVPVTVVRPFSGYGEDQADTYPFRAILDRVRALGPDDKEITVWCGDCVRDWVHVDDVVRGALAVAADGTEAPVNLCTGRPTSFWQLARIMLAQAGRPEVQVRALSDKPQGVMSRVGNPNRLNSLYRPTVTLEEGIRRALAL